MTPELHDRWHRDAAPFDGCTASLTGDTSWDVSLLILRTIGESLAQHASCVLRFADWHEHDGFVTLPETTTVSDLIAGWETRDSFCDVVPQDEYVSMAAYPPAFEWLLRFGATDIDAPPDDVWPHLDFTASASSYAYDLLNTLLERWPGYLERFDASDYFRAGYGG